VINLQFEGLRSLFWLHYNVGECLDLLFDPQVCCCVVVAVHRQEALVDRCVFISSHLNLSKLLSFDIISCTSA
jgi:hypothetical protein